MAQEKIILNGWDQLRKYFTSRLTPGNVRKRLSLAGSKLIERVRINTQNERDVYGEKFVPLAPSTIKQKQRKGFPTNRTLRETLAMHNSYFRVATPRSLSIGNKRKYLAAHMFGTKHIPQRNPLDAGEFAEFVLDFLDF